MQKSYTDVRRKHLECGAGDKVFLQISPVKGVMRFGKKGDLNPRFMGLYGILERIGVVAYWIALPPELECTHDVSHASMSRKYIPDPTHILTYKPCELDEDFAYMEFSEKIVDQKEHVLHNCTVSFIKVKWMNHPKQEAS
ncbi:uncharacterized protein LOC122063399 [Macadamia integrifolia]|uniref:uncharacterized protein LOC122063399 n=1 Tax=Macadamia integrifolia TaxID=60698 RepID=UPI001C4EDF35|nr:uncharacterized protein LOC122063399 [Macadamia integrifolia]